MRAKQLTLTLVVALLCFGGAAQAHGEGETRPVVDGWSISAIWINDISGLKCPQPNEPPESHCLPHDTITQNGVERYRYPSSGEWPVSLTVGRDGNIWLADVGGYPSSSIDEFNPTTNELTRHTVRPWPTEIIVGPDGNLWFASLWPGIGRITTSGEVTEYPLPPATGPVDLHVEGGELGFREQWAGVNARITTTGQISQLALPRSSRPGRRADRKRPRTMRGAPSMTSTSEENTDKQPVRRGAAHKARAVARAIGMTLAAIFDVGWIGGTIYAGIASGWGAALLWFLLAGFAAGYAMKLWQDRNKPSSGRSWFFAWWN